ncbi:MAG: MarR family transcriptional regulator [Methylotenera sp.]|nr:MarR family transcriptional regulator [Oligoflexia bacterium]
MSLFLSKLPEKEFYQSLSKTFPCIDPSSVETLLRLRKLAADLDKGIDQFLQSHSLLSGRFSVLMQLAYAKDPEGLKSITLAELLGVTRGNMTGLLDGLEEAGLVVRVSDSRDRRIAYIQLTKKGRDTVTKVGADYFKRVCKMMSRVSEKEKSSMNKSLEKMNELMAFK